ncbi:hypothetical protein [Bartonella sp. DGB2]|uniref:hypothetical protein n=1 Tax=Bartonella sp. DGB2 TaxID=3388426 RepID=UPI0039901647
MQPFYEKDHFWSILIGFIATPFALVLVVYPTVVVLKLIICTAFGLEINWPTTAHKAPTTIEDAIQQDKGKASDCLY